MVHLPFFNSRFRLPGAVRRDGKRGQSMVELALAGPMLMFMTLGVADLGRAFYYKEATSNSARQAIRLAATDQSVGNFVCANGVAGVLTRNLPDLGSDVVSRVVNTAALESTSNGLASGSVLKNSTAATTVTLTFHCIGAVAYTNSTATSTNPTNSHSDAVEVQVDYAFKMITPLIGGLFTNQTIHIRADQFGRAEY